MLASILITLFYTQTYQMVEGLPSAALQNYFSVMRPSTWTMLPLERSSAISVSLDKRKRWTLEILCCSSSYHIVPEGPTYNRNYQVNIRESLLGCGRLV